MPARSRIYIKRENYVDFAPNHMVGIDRTGADIWRKKANYLPLLICCCFILNNSKAMMGMNMAARSTSPANLVAVPMTIIAVMLFFSTAAIPLMLVVAS